jgi:hypothetical protein
MYLNEELNEDWIQKPHGSLSSLNDVVLETSMQTPARKMNCILRVCDTAGTADLDWIATCRAMDTRTIAQQLQIRMGFDRLVFRTYDVTPIDLAQHP